MFFEAISKL